MRLKKTRYRNEYKKFRLKERESYHRFYTLSYVEGRSLFGTSRYEPRRSYRVEIVYMRLWVIWEIPVHVATCRYYFLQRTDSIACLSILYSQFSFAVEWNILCEYVLSILIQSVWWDDLQFIIWRFKYMYVIDTIGTKKYQ